MRILLKFFLAASFFLLFLPLCQGQTINDNFMLLKDHLKFLEKKHQVTFSYDSDLISGIKIQADTTEAGLDEALLKIKEQTAFDFETTNTGNVLLKPKQPGANLRLCGTMIDEESTEPLSWVSIYNKNKTFQMEAGENGSFSAYVHLSDIDKLYFSYLGSEIKELSADFFNGTGCPVISVKMDEPKEEEVVIKAYLSSGINYNFKENAIVVNPKGIGLLPGETDADILMALDALPGLNSPDSRAGNLNIRGSTPDQTLILFDNIPIYHKGHYFGTFSPYNSFAVDNIKVSRSAYTADKGGRVAGAIEIASKKNIPDSVLSGVSLSSTFASAYTQIPLIKNKLGILLAGRSSYPFNWTSPKLKAINNLIYQKTGVSAGEDNPSMDVDKAFNFYDVNAKLTAKPGKNDEILLSFLGISNKVDIAISNNQSKSVSYYNMKLENWGYNFIWSKKISRKISTALSATQSNYSQSFPTRIVIEPDSLIQSAFYKNQINDIDLKLETNIAASQHSAWKIGYDFHYNNLKYINSFLNRGVVAVDISRNDFSYLNTMFLNYSFTHSKFTANAGLRGSYYIPSQKFYFEPRLIMNYFMDQHFALKASAGICNQFISQIPGIGIETVGGIENPLWLLCNDSSIPVVKSRQAMFGALYKRNSWILDAELYYKKTDKLSINNINNFNSPANPFFYGSGNTIGADFLIKKRWNKLDAWISYTLSRTQLQFDSIQSQAFLSPMNQTHILDIVAAYNWKQWKFSLGWKFRSGLPALPFIRTKYMHGAPPQVGLSNPPPPPPPSGGPPPPVQNESQYTNLFPVYHQLDLSIVYALPKMQKSWNSTLGLSIVNLYNRKNVIEQQPVRLGNGLIILTRYAMGFAPNLVFTVNW
jgi:hypothetical protein